MDKTFLEAIKDRRTCYAIGGGSPVSDERIREAVGQAVLHVPSAFNSQSTRTVLLFGGAHHKFWSIVMETLRSVVPPANFAKTEEKIRSFAAGHGTVLYFDETETTKALMEQFPTYRDNFPVWAQQANGMLQFAVWTLLEQEGLGASLQHYNPLIDDAVRAEWKLPQSWQLIAQMPFGEPAGKPGPKEFLPLDSRMATFQ